MLPPRKSLRPLAVTLVLSLLAGLSAAARAEGPSLPAAPELEVRVALTAPPSEPGGLTLTVTVLARGLPAGRVFWSVPGAVAAGLAAEGAPAGAAAGSFGAFRLTGSDGQGAVLETAPDGSLAAETGAGDWTLTYDGSLSAAGPGLPSSSVPSFVLIPAGVACLPLWFAPAGPGLEGSEKQRSSLPRQGWRSVGLTVTAPEGWTLLPGFPAAMLPVPEWRFGRLRYWVGVGAPQVVLASGAGAEVGTGAEVGAGAAVGLVWAEVGLGWTETAVPAAAGAAPDPLVTVRLAAERFGAAFGAPGSAVVLVSPGVGEADLAGDTLDALWLLAGPVAPPDAAGARFLDQGLWPLARHNLLVTLGLADDANLLPLVEADDRAYRGTLGDAGTATALDGAATALDGAPLASAYLFCRFLGTSPERLLALTLEAAGAAGGSAAPLPAVEQAVRSAGLSPVAAAGLLLRLSSSRDLPPFAWAGTSFGPPRLGPGQTFVPLRALAESLGLPLAWRGNERRVVVGTGPDELAFPIDSYRYLKGGRSHFGGGPTRVVGGRALTSLECAARALGQPLLWDPATQTVVAGRGPYVPAVPEPSPGRVAYLTFDDGPDPALTARILAVLAEYQVKATFFVVGYAADHSPGLLRRIVAEGHALANHTLSHRHVRGSAGWIYRSPEAYLAELDACDAVIAAATGLHPTLTRPPGGSHPYLTRDFIDLLQSHGYSTRDWDASAGDSAWPRPSADAILANIVAKGAGGTRSRLIILMHDGGGRHETTLEALPAIIEFLRENGYALETLRG